MVATFILYNMQMKWIIVLLLVKMSFINCQAQVLNERDTIVIDSSQDLKFKYKQLIIPTVLIGYGVVGLNSDLLKGFNSDISDEANEHNDKKLTIDDFTRYVPAASVYILNAAGVEGKNNLRDRSVILATSCIITATTVLGLKSVTNVERPDGSDNNSFPSGHTAVAFSGAEFLWQEYKDKSVWYGIGGYVVATGTGIIRIYNNKHWLTDVAAGAGIGILSTKIAYWVHPYINKKLFHNKYKKTTTFLMPFYNGREMGCGLVINL